MTTSMNRTALEWWTLHWTSIETAGRVRWVMRFVGCLSASPFFIHFVFLLWVSAIVAAAPSLINKGGTPALFSLCDDVYGGGTWMMKGRQSFRNGAHELMRSMRWRRTSDCYSCCSTRCAGRDSPTLWYGLYPIPFTNLWPFHCEHRCLLRYHHRLAAGRYWWRTCLPAGLKRTISRVPAANRWTPLRTVILARLASASIQTLCRASTRKARAFRRVPCPCPASYWSRRKPSHASIWTQFCCNDPYRCRPSTTKWVTTNTVISDLCFMAVVLVSQMSLYISHDDSRNLSWNHQLLLKPKEVFRTCRYKTSISLN